MSILPLNLIDTSEVLHKVRVLRQMYLTGLLGGEVMPEDANPSLPPDSAMNYLYFTLPMALNYQRNSYTLWMSAQQAYADVETVGIFHPGFVAALHEDRLRELLLKYKVALQPNKHTATWRTLCLTINTHFEGDIRNLFIDCDWNIPNILNYVQKRYKKDFPYLCGPKICNYWLYVISNYTAAKLSGKEELSIAPDTHVIQATARFGLIEEKHMNETNIQLLVNKIWKNILSETELSLIDLHTPLWLWSRSGFKEMVDC